MDRLPMDVLRHIYSYDSTKYLWFDKVLHQLKMRRVFNDAYCFDPRIRKEMQRFKCDWDLYRNNNDDPVPIDEDDETLDEQQVEIEYFKPFQLFQRFFGPRPMLQFSSNELFHHAIYVRNFGSRPRLPFEWWELELKN